LPLGAGADPRTFKVQHLDIGLASAALGLDLVSLERDPDLTLVHRGAVAEQAVGQLLRLTFPSYAEPTLHYWHREERGAEAELDFVHAVSNQVVPVEVKSGATGSMKSLHNFMHSTGLDVAVRISTAPPRLDRVQTRLTTGADVAYDLLTIPVYLVERLNVLVDSALQRLSAVRAALP
jgi:hypothetical protein